MLLSLNSMLATATNTLSGVDEEGGSAIDKKQKKVLAVLSFIIFSLILLLFLFFYSLYSIVTKKQIRIWNALVIGIFAIAVGSVVILLPTEIDRQINKVDNSLVQLLPVSDETKKLFEDSFVIDLHADSLLWTRDLLQRNSYGHVDIPKLIEGNVAIQFFTIVTSVPLLLNMQTNERPSLLTDPVTYISLLSGWKKETISSKVERTVIQAQKLYHMSTTSHGAIRIISNKRDLQQYILDRKNNKKITASILGIEGAHALEGKIENVDLFFQHNIRMMAPTHFFDNKLGGSAHGVNKGGLTSFGFDVLRKMEEKGMIFDLAHASEQVILDAANAATKPLFNSHTGVRGVCPNPRNLNDKSIQAIANSGGVLGIGYFMPAVCGDNLLTAIVDSILYVKNLVGIEHVALGSDFDGAVTTGFDTTQIIQVAQGLRNANLTEEEVKLVLGGNVVNLLQQYLPN